MWDRENDPVEAVKYSVVIPIYNEQESIPALVARLRSVCRVCGSAGRDPHCGSSLRPAAADSASRHVPETTSM